MVLCSIVLVFCITHEQLQKSLAFESSGQLFDPFSLKLGKNYNNFWQFQFQDLCFEGRGTGKSKNYFLGEVQICKKTSLKALVS